MNEIALTRAFERIGARLKLGDLPSNWWRPIRIDVKVDRRGEIFTIDRRPDADLELTAISIDRPRRHLLLHERGDGRNHKFLCGHDERHWFVAGIPEAAPGVTSVRTAMQALEPHVVARIWSERSARAGERLRRRNSVSVRQGEWFFLSCWDMVVPERHIHRSWPLSRGEGSKPHILEECSREGGQTWFSCPQFPTRISEGEYRKCLRLTPEARNWSWETRVVVPVLYARGRVRHPDHATLHLNTWHRVFVNRETEAHSRAYVTFLD